jgi:7,8-dihydropterin-6-yl-methyl-4-(beta-D-ribofuranosyl)aminobenzene 5'-phosphate synthase
MYDESMDTRVLSVYDEGSIPGTPLIGARGFSVIVDADGERTLFGTGGRGPYLMHNLGHLEIDAGTVDRIVIPSMYPDHTGGMRSFLEKRDENIEMIIPDGDPPAGKKFLGMTIKKAGMPKLPEEVSAKADTRHAEGWTRLSENLYIASASGENSLVLITKEDPVLICGDCRCGPAVLIKEIEERTGKRISTIAGSIHLANKKKNEVYGIADMFRQNGPPSLYLGHRTGHTQKIYLREKLGLNAVNDFYAGTEIRFDTP